MKSTGKNVSKSQSNNDKYVKTNKVNQKEGKPSTRTDGTKSSSLSMKKSGGGKSKMKSK